MKTIKIFFTIAIMLASVLFTKAQVYNYKLDGPFAVTKTIKVNGICEMCKHRIETAVKNQPGVWSTYWNVDSKILVVKYDRATVYQKKIEQRIAAFGCDTENLKASDKLYAALPDCCHYPRAN